MRGFFVVYCGSASYWDERTGVRAAIGASSLRERQSVRRFVRCKTLAIQGSSVIINKNLKNTRGGSFALRAHVAEVPLLSYVSKLPTPAP